MLLEIACFNLESCQIAQDAGADRIEFCRNYSEGGLTPAREDIIEAMQSIKIPVHVILRPRAGNFVYDHGELEQMKQDLLFCKIQKINGFVFGVLKMDGTVHEEACRELIETAGPIPCTFHRAIDDCRDIHEGIEKLIRLGFKSVLTAGGKGNAIENIETLKQIQRKYGSKINIVAGGGVRSTNLKSLLEATGCSYYHSAAVKSSEEKADGAEILKMKSILKGI